MRRSREPGVGEGDNGVVKGSVPCFWGGFEILREKNLHSHTNRSILLSARCVLYLMKYNIAKLSLMSNWHLRHIYNRPHIFKIRRFRDVLQIDIGVNSLIVEYVC